LPTSESAIAVIAWTCEVGSPAVAVVPVKPAPPVADAAWALARALLNDDAPVGAVDVLAAGENTPCCQATIWSMRCNVACKVTLWASAGARKP